MGLLTKLGMLQEEPIEQTEQIKTIKPGYTTFKNIDTQNLDTKFKEDIFIPIEDNNSNNANSDNPYLDKLRKAYQDGFTKLNKPDIDFYELFDAVSSSGDLSSAEALKMAYKMCSKMNNNLTKEVLLQQADQYTKSIMNLYNDTKNSGEKKLSDLKSQIELERTTIDNTISKLEQDLETWKIKRDNFKSETEPKFKEINQKILANNIANNELMNNITNLQNNIKNNL